MDHTQFFQKLQEEARKMNLFIKMEFKREKTHVWVYSSTYMTGTLLSLEELINLPAVDFKELAAREDLKTVTDKLTAWGISPSEIHEKLDECFGEGR